MKEPFVKRQYFVCIDFHIKMCLLVVFFDESCYLSCGKLWLFLPLYCDWQLFKMPFKWKIDYKNEFTKIIIIRVSNFNKWITTNQMSSQNMLLNENYIFLIVIMFQTLW